FEFVSGFSGRRQGNNQLVGGGFEFYGRSVERHALDGQADRVEKDFRGAATKDRKRVRNFTEDSLLVKVEPQGDLGMLQIIVAAARVRLIGAELRRGDENRQQRRERKKRRRLPWGLAFEGGSLII